MWRGWTPPERTLGVREGPLERAFSSADSAVRPIHVEVEPRDDSGVVAGGKLGNPRRDPGVVVLRVGDDVGIAPGAHCEDPGRLVVRVAEGVQARPSLRAEQVVARSE